MLLERAGGGQAHMSHDVGKDTMDISLRKGVCTYLHMSAWWEKLLVSRTRRSWSWPICHTAHPPVMSYNSYGVLYTLSCQSAYLVIYLGRRLA